VDERINEHPPKLAPGHVADPLTDAELGPDTRPRSDEADAVVAGERRA